MYRHLRPVTRMRVIMFMVYSIRGARVNDGAVGGGLGEVRYAANDGPGPPRSQARLALSADQVDRAGSLHRVPDSYSHSPRRPALEDFSMSIRHFFPNTVYKTGVFPQVVVVDRSDGSKSIHVAGTFGVDTERNLVGDGGMAAQVAQALHNVRRSLEYVGAAASDIVRVKWYVTDLDLMMRDGRAPAVEFFGDSFPASTAVQVVALAQPGALVELEAYAETS